MREHQIVINLKREQFEEVQRLARLAGSKSVSAYLKERVLSMIGLIPNQELEQVVYSPSAQELLGINSEIARMHRELQVFIAESLSNSTFSDDDDVGYEPDLEDETYAAFQQLERNMEEELSRLQSEPDTARGAQSRLQQSDTLHNQPPEPTAGTYGPQAFKRADKPSQRFDGNSSRQKPAAGAAGQAGLHRAEALESLSFNDDDDLFEQSNEHVDPKSGKPKSGAQAGLSAHGGSGTQAGSSTSPANEFPTSAGKTSSTTPPASGVPDPSGHSVPGTSPAQEVASSSPTQRVAQTSAAGDVPPPAQPAGSGPPKGTTSSKHASVVPDALDTGTLPGYPIGNFVEAAATPTNAAPESISLTPPSPLTPQNPVRPQKQPSTTDSGAPNHIQPNDELEDLAERAFAISPRLGAIKNTPPPPVGIRKRQLDDPLEDLIDGSILEQAQRQRVTGGEETSPYDDGVVYAFGGPDDDPALLVGASTHEIITDAAGAFVPEPGISIPEGTPSNIEIPASSVDLSSETDIASQPASKDSVPNDQDETVSDPNLQAAVSTTDEQTVSHTSLIAQNSQLDLPDTTPTASDTAETEYSSASQAPSPDPSMLGGPPPKRKRPPADLPSGDDDERLSGGPPPKRRKK